MTRRSTAPSSVSRLTRRRRVGLALALVAALVLTVALVIARGDGSTAPSRLTPQAAAEQACRHVDAARAGIDANDRARDVLRLLQEAERSAASAAERDSRYFGLLGSVQALQLGLQGNNPRDARIATLALQQHCAGVS